MKLKLGLRRGADAVVDVVVTADATATVQDVAHALADGVHIDRGSVPTLVVTTPTGQSMQLDPTALIAQAPIGSGFDAAVVPAVAAPESGSAATAALLRIHNGPEAGRTIPLPHGASVIGRVSPASVVLDDPLVSKRHARIDVDNGIELVDLNSANGLLVDGGLVQRVRVLPGQIITIGATEVSFAMVAGVAGDDARVLERGGALMFNRSPRVEVRYPGREHRHPLIPNEADPRIFPWPMIMAPVLLGFAMFGFTQRASSLLIVLMAPLMMFGNFIGQRTQQGKKLKLEIETFETQIDELEDRLLSEEVLERDRRRAEAPATATVYENAMALGPLLWTRRPEHWNFLGLRLGVGASASRGTIQEATDQRGIAEYAHRVNALRDRFATIEGVPLVELLPSAGAIGIAGPKDLAADVVRGIGVQLFGLHAPNEVVTAAIIDPGWTGDIEWMKWLPHTTSPRSPFAEMALADSQSAGTALLNALEEMILARLSASATRRGPLGEGDTSMALGRRVGEMASSDKGAVEDVSLVLFVSNDAPVDRPRLTQVIERGPDAGVYTVFVAPTVESLPAACRTFIDVTGGLDDATVGWVRAGERAEGVVVEGVSREYADLFAKRMAPVVDSSSVAADSSDLPGSVSLLRLVGTDMAEEPGAVIERWRQTNSVIDRTPGPRPRLKRASTLKAFVGQGSPDAMSLDLRGQGPHALVGGTTGSGKSEFLQAWVLGMAAEYSPDRVTFLFVDYKGGSAFADCVELPHCVGLVTDLSPHLVRRALTSLRAELHHREHLFHRKKAKDLLELEKRQDPETPPALVLVIDEFAALVGEVPEFVDGVVDIAQRGRSLGIHLIMATQRPAGVIKDNLRANTNLRVALRMADEADSTDVVGEPLAAGFDPSLPGRGIAKTGPGRLVPFQSGYAGGWTADEPDRAQVRVAELRFGSLVQWESAEESESDTHDDDLGPNDQKRLVATLVRATAEAGIPAPRRPWLDDLAGTIDLRALPLDGGDSRIPIGLADIPERQLQDAVFFEPDTDGHMLVYGTSGAGKSAALRTIAIGAGARPDLGRTVVYAIDFGTGALRSLEVLPHVGSVVSGDDVERVQRLLRTLRGILDDRSKRYSAVSAATLGEYRQITGELSEPRIIVLIDGFGVFKQDWETTSARAAYYAIFMRMLGEGRPLGVHVVATADRYGAVPTAVSANVTKRIVLRMSDEGAYSILGVAKDVLSERSAPGRAIVDGFEAQVAVIGGTTNVAEQTLATEQFAAALRAAGAVEAREIGSLPVELVPAELPDRVDDLPVLGVGDDTLGPKGFEPIGTFVVAGPPQSGKTTALRGIVAAMERFDPEIELFHVGGRRAALRDFRPWQVAASGIEDVRALAKSLKDIVADEAGGKRIVIVVENIVEFGDTDAERPLKELFQAINRSDHLLIADGDVSQLSGGYGLVGELKAGRHGIALRPDSYDGDSLFKVPFPKVQRHEFPVGRGLFVENGRIVTVQLPRTDR
ncbi:FtsK/SpoIIIE domain-containing protein [Microbacterium terricola]|uniref:Cell division protein FtsK n=1 Tax=Microbacterium terricola TaxID=344163 RepID=A0ABM8DVM0_9MICO|nr:FtsK/SpoIIIE domain-containing protein [Microbacterium terricola]UYK39561.1 FtsK/SpoIIIE domain-containing protein [Microbacterium terricola]BDV29704.1 cell division protein FtsK [Microbacterium terricola]